MQRTLLFLIANKSLPIYTNPYLGLGDDPFQGLVELVPLTKVCRRGEQLQELEQLHVQPRRRRPVVQVLRRASLVENLVL